MVKVKVSKVGLSEEHLFRVNKNVLQHVIIMNDQLISCEEIPSSLSESSIYSHITSCLRFDSLQKGDENDRRNR